ncbi:Pycsar system effector family protein [uncultured Maribacter sp.]|uniref:Pycsar system effector family protein n=1 Tax=uncultured Maribacter sp. TaxID=431308 RepID=UPI0030ECBDA4|tara:strand:- start:22371 stop:23003 length:633 start_codon:yes stop_codon:yes gene_type:complete
MTKPLPPNNEKNTKTKEKENQLSAFEKGLLDELKSKGHAEELVDHYWGTINYISNLIRASEVKAGFILSFYGILLNFMFQSAESVLSSEASRISIVLYVLIVIWLIATLISIFFSIRCFIPKLEGGYKPNVFYFGDVINKFGTIKEFARTFYRISLDEDEVFEQLGEQIYINSKIAAWKFKNVQLSIRYLAIGLFLLFITALTFTVTNHF